MTALATERDTPMMGQTTEPVLLGLPVAAGAKIFGGSMVCDNGSGYAVPATASTALIALGRAEETVDNTDGAAGDKTIKVRRGVFKLENGDTITIANRMALAYFGDDQTAYKADGSGTRPIGGLIIDVESDGVWVAVGASNVLAGVTSKVQAMSLAIGHADLTEADGAQSFDFASALPANAVILGYDVRVTEGFTDGAAGTFTMDVGISGGDLDQLVDGIAIGAIANLGNAPGVRPTGRYGAITLAATVLGSVNVDTATAGALTVEVFYALT